MIGRVPLRLRVALAFTLTTAVALTGLGFFVYLRVQDTLRDQAEQALRTQAEALGTLPASQRVRAVEQLTGVTFAQVLSSGGDLVASSPQLTRAVAEPGDVREPQPRQRAILLRGDDEAEPALLLTQAKGNQVLVVGRSLEPAEEALDGVRTQFFLGLPLALLVASAVGYGVAGTALRPVDRMRREAASISALGTRARLPLPTARDEIWRLGSTLNAMLDRLEAAADRERDFVAEAGHELRTPLALLRMELDLALSAPRSSEELLAALRSAGEEVERLTSLAEDLLLLADHGDGVESRESVVVPVEALVGEEVRRYSTLAARAGRRVRLAVESPGAVRGDPARLGRALGNLVHNALVHGEGDVTVRARTEDGSVVLVVEDEGPGVAPEVQDRTFARRGRAARTPGSADHGLGLAIVRLIVEEHGGTMELTGHHDGVPSAVTVRLPPYAEG